MRKISTIIINFTPWGEGGYALSKPQLQEHHEEEVRQLVHEHEIEISRRESEAEGRVESEAEGRMSHLTDQERLQAHRDDIENWAREKVELCEMHKKEVSRLEMHISNEESKRESVEKQQRAREDYWEAQVHAVKEAALYEQHDQLALFETEMRKMEQHMHENAQNMVDERIDNENGKLRENLDATTRYYEVCVAELEEQLAQLQDDVKLERVKTRKEREQHEIDMDQMRRKEREKLELCERACRTKLAEMEEGISGLEMQLMEEKQRAWSAASTWEKTCLSWNREKENMNSKIIDLSERCLQMNSLRKKAMHRLSHAESTVALADQMRRTTENDTLEDDLLGRIRL